MVCRIRRGSLSRVVVTEQVGSWTYVASVVITIIIRIAVAAYRHRDSSAPPTDLGRRTV